MIITYDIQRLIGLNILIITTSLSVIILSNIGLVYAVEFKNYTSEQFKIQFQYPSDWSVDEKMSRFDEGADLQISPSSPGTFITIMYIEDGTELEDVKAATYESLKQSINDYKYEFKVIERPSFLEIDNQSAGTFIYSMKDKYEDYAILWGIQHWDIYAGDHGYLILYMTRASSFDNPENVEIRNKFINSIEFLGDISLIESSNTPSRFG